jgi:hypothetical protein
MAPERRELQLRGRVVVLNDRIQMNRMITGYWPLFLATPSLTELDTVHLLGGTNNMRGATSPNSGRPLLRLMSYDCQDSKLRELGWKPPRMDLFFSWTCAISRGDFFYQITSADELRILTYAIGDSYDDFPYSNYPVVFPQRQFVLRRIEESEQDSIIKANADSRYRIRLTNTRPDLTRPQHQIGGVPHFVQPPRDLVCPLCTSTMPLAASVSNESMSERPFVDNNFVQILFHACVGCSVLAAYANSD